MADPAKYKSLSVPKRRLGKLVYWQVKLTEQDLK